MQPLQSHLRFSHCVAARRAAFFLLLLIPSSDEAIGQQPTDFRLQPFEMRAEMASDAEQLPSHVRRMPPVPEDYLSWWDAEICQPLIDERPSKTVSIDSLLMGALDYSSQVRVLKDLPLIRRTSIIEAEAEFDWTAFLDTKWNDISEPVGSVLTTGGPPRFSDHKWDHSMGMRRQLSSGANVEAAQELGWEDSNSVFFIPGNQGTSRLKLSYTQPLLRGAGRVYNTSLIVLAEIDTSISQAEFSSQLQDHLLEVVRAYWRFYHERGSLLQKKRLYHRAEEIYNYLIPRAKLDASRNQIARTRAAVTARRSDLVRAEAAVRNSEARIRALVNDPALSGTENVELLPETTPARAYVPISMRESLTTALQHRPEIHQALKQIKASATRLEMSKNELLPVLDMIIEGYASGLAGSSDIGEAFSQQFRDGAPSYTAGIQFEMPLNNRAARARYQRRQLELRQVANQLDTTAETVMMEVEVAVREVHTSFREIHARYQAMIAARSEVDYIHARWQRAASNDRTGSLVLENLLSAQERLTEAESRFLEAEVMYNLSLLGLKRVVGLLLEHEHIVVGEAHQGHLPELILDKDSVSTRGIQPEPVEPAVPLETQSTVY